MTGLLCCISLLFSASDTLPAADTAFIVGKRLMMASRGKNVIVFPRGSQWLNQDLAAAGICIRQYGPSGIGSITRRGADPSQIQVLWNGMVLNNPMLGMADLSLLQNDASTEVKLSEGGSGSFYGSGSVGGTLSLQHKSADKLGSNINTDILTGSFGRRELASHWNWSRPGLFFTWNHNFNTAENDFTYRIPGSESMKMEFARRSQYRSSFSTGFSVKHWNAELHSEWQKGNRGLGTPAGGGSSLGWQEDENLRTVLSLNYTSDCFKLVQRLGLIRDDIIFQLPGYSNPDSSRSTSKQYQQEWHFNSVGLQWITGIDLLHVSAFTKNYTGTASNLYPAQFVAVSHHRKKVNLSASARWEWNEKIPVGSFSVERSINNNWRLKTNVCNSFRRPTLNDLYWSNGGNTKIKAEKGGSIETGLAGSWQRHGTTVSLNTAIWMRYLNNPIVWLPGNNVWSVTNLDRGDYHGVQLSLSVDHKWGDVLFFWVAGGEWCEAKITRESIVYNALFVPGLTGSGHLRIQHKHAFLNIQCQGQSERFISTDNLSSLPAYALFSCHAGKEFNRSEHHFLLTAGADNLFNQNYQVMPGRPMPLRTLWMKLTLKLHYKK
jgi:iron complex outermembrane receptor protein